MTSYVLHHGFEEANTIKECFNYIRLLSNLEHKINGI